MRKIRYENVALLALAAVFSVIATVVLSGFLEPSQPPAVAAVQIGEPREDAGPARERAERPRRGRGTADASRRADGPSRARPNAGQAAPSREPRRAPSPQPSQAPRPEPTPLQPIAPAEPDDDASGEQAEADDAED
jgi:hypothetical protein